MTATGGNFLISVALARIMGAEGYGIYVYAMSWASLLLVPTTMGLPTLLTREAAHLKAAENWSPLRGILTWSDRMVLAVSLVLAVGAAATIWFFSGKIEARTRLALWAAMAVLPLRGLLRIKKGQLRGLGHVVKGQLPEMLLLPVLFLSLITTSYYLTDLMAVGAVTLRVIAIGGSLLIAIILTIQYAPEEIKTVDNDYRWRGWVRASMPLLFTSTAKIMNQKVSVVVLGIIIGPKSVGIFEVARKGGKLVSLVLQTVNFPIGPEIAKMYGNIEIKQLQGLAVKSARLMFGAALPIAILIFLFGGEVLTIFGKEFRAGHSTLALITIGHLVNAAMVVELPLTMTGHQYYAAKALAVSCVLNVVLNIVLIEAIGLEGAGLAISLNMLLSNFLMFWYVYKKIKINSTIVGKKW